MLSKTFQECVSSTRLIVFCFDFYLRNSVKFFSIEIKKSNLLKFCWIIWCNSLFVWQFISLHLHTQWKNDEVTAFVSAHSSRKRTQKIYIINYMIILSEYIIAYSFKRFVRNLFCNRISETKSKCIQQFALCEICRMRHSYNFA